MKTKEFNYATMYDQIVRFLKNPEMPGHVILDEFDRYDQFTLTEPLSCLLPSVVFGPPAPPSDNDEDDITTMTRHALQRRQVLNEVGRSAEGDASGTI